MLTKTEDKIEIDQRFLKKIKIAIVGSEFNGELTTSLANVCLEVLEKNGLGRHQVSLYSVPGSLEIPLMAKMLAKKRIFDAIIVFGVVIKGDTYHFETVANECARGCMDVSLKYEIPVIYEVLAVFNLSQAKARTGNDSNNKGREAAIAVLKTIKAIKSLGSEKDS